MSEPEPLVVVPPALVGSWHDAAPTIAEGALGRLGLGPGDQHAAQIADRALPACAAIDEYLELRPVVGRVTYTVGGRTVVTYATGDAPAPVYDAAVTLTVELYQRRLATFGVLDAGSPSGEPVRVTADHMRGVESILAPFVEGFALA